LTRYIIASTIPDIQNSSPYAREVTSQRSLERRFPSMREGDKDAAVEISRVAILAEL
jgi:hypothetical protein